MYYKVEAYTASERAGAILYSQNITTTFVSDNPVLNSQHVVFEAAKSYRNGLPYHAALAGVTSAPAELLGLGSRVGKIKAGFDADIVVWDSDPLSVGATPVQVWIDGAKQFKDPIELNKLIVEPILPDVGLLKELQKVDVKGTVVYTGIAHVSHDAFSNGAEDVQSAVAIVSNGALICVGTCKSQLAALSTSEEIPRMIALENGYLTAPLTSFGTSLGLQEIDAERETHDGKPPSDDVTFALDGISFGGKQLTVAFEHGVTRAISAPSYGGIDSRGISVAFKTGAKNRMEKGAILDPEVALHYPLTLRAKNSKTPSITSAIADLTNKVLDAIDELKSNKTDFPTKERLQESAHLRRVVQGELPLVFSADSADTIVAIIQMKAYFESVIADLLTSKVKPLRIVIIGGSEAHLVAHEIAAANIAIVLAPLLPHAQTWDQRRGLTGPPLTDVTTNILLDAGVLLGISVEEMWETRDLGLLAGIAFANSEGRLAFDEAIALVSANFDKMLGLEGKNGETKNEWVVWEGSPLSIEGRVRGLGGMGKSTVWV